MLHFIDLNESTPSRNGKTLLNDIFLAEIAPSFKFTWQTALTGTYFALAHYQLAGDTGMHKSTALALLLLASPIQAQWYETTGQALIRNGDKATARAQATEDAVKRALLFAGVSVRSVQQVTDGLLTQESLQLKSYGDMQQVHIVSERVQDGMFEVTIKADIFPTEPLCPTVAFKKKILISPFKLKMPEHAVIGGLFELGAVSSQRLTDKISEISQSSWPESFPSIVDTKQLPANERQAIEQQYQGRYLLTATLEDISLGSTQGINWEFWTDADRERFFHLQLTLFDLITNRTVFSQKYQTSGLWTVRKTTILDPNYQKFWQTDYGKATDRVLTAAAMDVEEAIRCEPILAEVKQVRQNQVLLNVGEAHGVKVGDTFTLIHRRDLNDNFGQSEQLYSVTPLTVKITQLSHQNAWAQSVDGDLLANIQIGDFASVAGRAETDEFSLQPE
jgi:hypothetical protein